MMVTHEGLHLTPGDGIDILGRTGVVHIRAIARFDCELCVLRLNGYCTKFACMPDERDDIGVHFIEVGKEFVV